MEGAGQTLFVLDNTAASNFAQVGRMDILRDRYGGRLVVTPEVLSEFEAGPAPQPLSRALEEDWITLRRVYADSGDYGILRELRQRGFGLGEAASLAVCTVEEGPCVFISDDADARKEARRRRLGVVGTYGVLGRQVSEGRMTLSEGNALLGTMIDMGFHSHSNDLGPEVSRLQKVRRIE